MRCERSYPGRAGAADQRLWRVMARDLRRALLLAGFRAEVDPQLQRRLARPDGDFRPQHCADADVDASEVVEADRHVRDPGERSRCAPQRAAAGSAAASADATWD